MAHVDIIADSIAPRHNNKTLAKKPITLAGSLALSDLGNDDMVTKSMLTGSIAPVIQTIEVGESLPKVITYGGFPLRPNVTVSKQVDSTHEEIVYDARVQYTFTDSTHTVCTGIIIAGYDDGTGHQIEKLYITIK